MVDSNAVTRLPPVDEPPAAAAPASAARAGPGTWLHRTSVGKKLTTVVLVFSTMIAWLMVLGVLSLKLSSAVRAYVAGEGLWSRAQKDGVFALDRYAVSRSEDDYAAFETSIGVIMGDRMARIEMEKPEYDHAVATRGLALGGNHPDDIPDMIFLFRHFRSVSYLRDAIAAWTQADVLVDRLVAHAQVLRRAVQSGTPLPEDLARIREDIRRVNDDLAVLELRFSATLAAGARWLHAMLLWLATLSSLALLALGVLLARRVGAQVRTGIAELQRGTARVAAGDFGTPIAVNSADELGELARAFNSMTLHRRAAAEALEQRVRFGNLVTRLSSQMTALQPAEVDAGMRQALSDISPFAGADRSFVFWFDEEGAIASCSHEWCAPGITPQIQRLQELPLAAFPWIRPMAECGEVVHVPRVADLPPAAAAERAEWEAESIRSLLLIPMKAGERVRGYVGFSSVREAKAWPQETQDLLRIFGEIVLNTIRRVNAETALRERNQNLAAAVQELERSNAELEEFAYVASHDLKTPLRGINGFIHLLRRRLNERLDSKAQEYIDLALQSVNQMQALIGGLLALSRIGKTSHAPVPTDCEAVLATVRDQLGTLIEERGVQLTHDPLPTVPATPLELHQLFQNLIANAIKFQPGRLPRVHVGAVREGAGWKFSVRDWGIGIRAEHRHRIFQIFQRLHAQDQYEGSGIGLSICRKIVHRHGGRIWVESEEGQGATFYFTLQT